jgi:hypothetical protein
MCAATGPKAGIFHLGSIPFDLLEFLEFQGHFGILIKKTEI